MGRQITDTTGAITEKMPWEEQLKGADDLIEQTVARSGREAETRASMTGELAKIVPEVPPPTGTMTAAQYRAAQKPPTKDLTALEALAKKRGAREGFERVERAQISHNPVPGPTKIDQLRGNNIQRWLEEADERRRDTLPLLTRMRQLPLAQVNARSGEIEELVKLLRQGAGEGGLGRRFLYGSVAGSLPQFAAETATSGAPLEQASLRRYGIGGAAGGIGYALAPAGLARLIQLLGEFGPATARGMSVHGQTRRRQPESRP